ncbi:MAG: riboflavin synthase [Bacteroidia bacterium]|nr:riboflavin synthase [Bacteroidia bacterium]
MFTGIIERMGTIESVISSGTNRTFEIIADFPDEIRVDQSIAHDGVCLTVTHETRTQDQTRYRVTAVAETLQKTRLGEWQAGDRVNIERCLRAGDRLDGHFVQGHVDTTAVVDAIEDLDGSWMIHFSTDPSYATLLVNKGSVCVNGVSLTVVEAGSAGFSVTIIPYTWEHTNFHALRPGMRVNLEFDILGKYIARILSQRPGLYQGA